MAETATWRTLVLWISKHIGQRFPDRLLRRVWPQEKLLAKIEVFHFDSAPQFQVRSDRVTPKLDGGGFNVFNWSPFKLAIVGFDLRISIDAREIHKCESRLPSEASVPPYARSGFYYEWELTDKQIVFVRDYGRDCIRINVAGHMIVRTVYGELRKQVRSNVLADINQGP